MSEIGSYELPKGWGWAKIPDLVSRAGVFIDGDWVESKDQDPNGDVRLIQLADVGDGAYRFYINNAKNMCVPLPPLAEQARIVAEIERRLSVCEELESVIETNLKRGERLRQAILKRAFEGKLVPQDPKDEPASVLLERILKEREEQKQSIVETKNRVKRKRNAKIRRRGRARSGVR